MFQSNHNEAELLIIWKEKLAFKNLINYLSYAESSINHINLNPYTSYPMDNYCTCLVGTFMKYKKKSNVKSLKLEQVML